MRRNLQVMALALGVVLSGFAYGQVGFGNVSPAPLPGDYSRTHIVVSFQPWVTPTVKATTARRFGLTVNEAMSSRQGHFSILQLPAGSGARVESLVRAFSADPSVRFAELDRVLVRDFIPNDTRFGVMWGLHNTGQSGGTADADIDAPEAWESATGLPEVIVAVADDGFDMSHEDLAGAYHVNVGEIPGNGIDDDGNGFVDDVSGWDFADNDNDPNPDSPFDSHGTHVAGTVGAVHNNGIGVTGIGPNIRIMPLKIIGSTFWMSALANAIDYAANNGATALNVSYNLDGFTQAVSQAIGRANQEGMVYVNSAGNNSQQNPPRQALRQQHDNVIFVVASNRNDGRAGFSNWGNLCEIAAPGQDIMSTLPGNAYGNSSGTSMAAPHVAGIVGMVRAAFPELTPRQALDQIIESADSVGSLSAFVPNGARANLASALAGIGVATAQGVSVPMGTLNMGSLASLSAGGDGDAVVVNSAFMSGRGAYSAIEVSLLSTANPARLRQISAEVTSMAQGSRVSQFIHVYNWRTGGWTLIGSGRLTGEYRLQTGLLARGGTDHINHATGEIRLRIMGFSSWTRRGVVPPPFQLWVDSLVVRTRG